MPALAASTPAGMLDDGTYLGNHWLAAPGAEPVDPVRV
jgi:hypothetical protein